MVRSLIQQPCCWLGPGGEARLDVWGREAEIGGGLVNDVLYFTDCTGRG